MGRGRRADSGGDGRAGLAAGADGLDPILQVQELAVGLVIEVAPARTFAENLMENLMGT